MLAAQMYLGGVSTQIGWLLFGFGSMFFWAFAWHADLSGWRFSAGNVGRVTGEILNCRETSYSMGGSDDSSGDPVYANEYHFSLNGESIGGVSYSTGDCASNPITVEYLIGHPDVSRIAGTRRDIMSPWGVLIAILPGVGLLFVVLGWRRGALRVRLLRHGVMATGRVTEKVATNSETMGRRDYLMRVAFTAGDGSTQSVAMRTNRPEDLKGGPQVLHDPRDPSRALPLADMPGSIKEDRTGRLTGKGAWKSMALPAIALLINGLFVWKNL
jgi:hypothetical protein